MAGAASAQSVPTAADSSGPAPIRRASRAVAQAVATPTAANTSLTAGT